MLNSIRLKWQSRRRYKSVSDMSDLCVAILGLLSFLPGSYLMFVLSGCMPQYLRTANSIPLSSWGWRGWMVSAILAMLAFLCWLCGNIAWRCNGIIRDRWFK